MRDRAFFVTTLSETEIRIESLALGGDGIGKLSDGRIIFIPFTAIGDRVRVRVTVSKEKFARGEVTEILEEAPGREQPPCPYYEMCAGCQYQHLNYEEELRAKEQQVRDAVQRIGKIDPACVQPIIASPQRYGYRNRITLHRQEGIVGFYGQDNRKIISIDRCELADASINQQLQSRDLSRGPDQRLTLRTSETGAGFSQANLHLQDELLQIVCKAAPKEGKILIEGYAGNGWFTEALAQRFQQTIAIELDQRLVEMARKKFSENTNVEILSGECEHWLPELIDKHGASVDLLLLDPPRTGLSQRITDVVSIAPAGAAHLRLL
jgi:23S rRNA (uracil1939-C5)-methyltransferase